jgi:DNA-binding LytR/AlgR family response regulator
MKVLLVDDEKYIRDEFKYFLEKYSDIEICGETGRGDEVIPLIKKLKPDLIFLDINLQTDSGLIIARKILEMKNPPQIVLATAFDQHAVKGFEMGVVDYIVKPIMEDRLKKCIDRARKNMDNYSKKEEKKDFESHMDKIAVKKSDKFYLIKLKDVVYLEYSDNRINVFTRDEKYYMNMTMKEFVEKSGPAFIRTHKSFIVNLDYVNEIIPWFNYTFKLRLKHYENNEIPVSRSYLKDFKNKLNI